MSLMHILPGGGFASKRIFQERRKVRFMYREIPDNENDSGWRLFVALRIKRIQMTPPILQSAH
jgi:hypothetical protein